MKYSLKMLFLVILVSSALISCQQKGTDQTAGSNKDKTVIATVNGNPVTEDEVKFEFSQLPENLQKMTTTKEGFTTLLDDILKKEMLYQEAKKKNLDKSDEYNKRLQDLKRRLMVELLLTQEVESKTTVTDEEAKKFYDDNRDRFVTPSAPGVKGKKEEPVPFEQVKDLIKNRLLQQKQRQAFQDYVDSLSKSYTVKLKKDAIKKSFGISIENQTGALENGTEEIPGTNAVEQSAPAPKDSKKPQK